MQSYDDSHATTSLDHTSSLAAPVAQSSDHANTKAKYMCERCDVLFGRWDSLQRHVRTVCSRRSRNNRSSSSSSSSSSLRISTERITFMRNNMD